ncbi:MAG: hypothetical protein FWF02_14680 [Micrococcales bacterium]|nr:hypothetical protein [Micrococcales bacterium]MCL2668924.1 hypothetical protein [Micrococcales bacterium]
MTGDAHDALWYELRKIVGRHTSSFPDESPQLRALFDQVESLRKKPLRDCLTLVLDDMTTWYTGPNLEEWREVIRVDINLAQEDNTIAARRRIHIGTPSAALGKELGRKIKTVASSNYRTLVSEKATDKLREGLLAYCGPVGVTDLDRSKIEGPPGQPDTALAKPATLRDWKALTAELLQASRIDIVGRIAPWPLLNELIAAAETQLTQAEVNPVGRLVPPPIRYTTTVRPSSNPFYGMRWDNANTAVRNYNVTRLMILSENAHDTAPSMGESVRYSPDATDQCFICAEWPDRPSRVYAAFGMSPPDRRLPDYLVEVADNETHNLTHWLRMIFDKATGIELRSAECHSIDSGEYPPGSAPPLKLKRLADYGSRQTAETLRLVAIVIPTFKDTLFMFMRHRICNFDNDGRKSFPSTWIRPQDIVSAHHGVTEFPPFKTAEEEHEWLERSFDNLTIDLDTVRTAAARAFLNHTGFSLPLGRFNYRALIVDQLPGGGQIGYAVMRLDLSAEEQAWVRESDKRKFDNVVELLRVTQAAELLAAPHTANQFTREHHPWLAQELGMAPPDTA